MKTLLPIGSVVLLKDGQKRLMIYGRAQKERETEVLYDYIGCFYPEGIINTDTVILFNNEDIERVYFVGFQDEDEFAFQKVLSDYLESNAK